MLQYEDLQVRLAAPYQLNPKPEAQDLGFGKYFTDHMLKVPFDKQLGGWQKPEISPFENLSFHPAAKGLHYAIQVRKQCYSSEVNTFRALIIMMNLNEISSYACYYQRLKCKHVICLLFGLLC